MSDPNTSAVSLPACSFDYDALKSGLDKAAKGAAKNYDTAREQAIADSATVVYEDADTRAIPGYKLEEVTNQLGGVENVQVYDPKLGEKIADEDAGTGLAIPVPTPEPDDGSASKE